ncbi:MAG TPA: carboxypeptidase [Firmicutes bacterium]|nr:carboxypeptidase [Candidatus Fermentithermobacillaceae bacterium]
MNLRFDKYHTYREITEFLQSCVSAYPGFCKLDSIGKSLEGRDIWMLEITNRKTGPGCDKPAVYADGNIHAGEVTGAETILWAVKHLLGNYDKDRRITYLLDTRVFYFIPRIAVDGAEYYLTTPDVLRSSVRQWPDAYDDKPGLCPEDVDGDGRILFMRKEDPDGGWKISGKDPRLMVRRGPHELPEPGTAYYHVYIEGMVKDFDPGLPVEKAPEKHSLDFNRNFPTNWAVHTRQKGSGDYPFSEPEMKAVADFFVSHPNIVLSMSYHTYGGYVLRPFCSQSDTAMDVQDLQIYLAAGEVAEDVTGYPCKSIYQWFTRDQTRPSVGSALEWAYETLGILALATELWDMRGRAGLPKEPAHTRQAVTCKEREEEELTLLKWNDKVMNGTLFINWYEFDHPQLGLVEIGGWEPKFGRDNPPLCFLEEECRKNGLFILDLASMAPRLAIEKATANPLGNGLYKIDAVVKNQGYLPSHGTFSALKMNRAEPVRAVLDISPGQNPEQPLGSQGAGIETPGETTLVAGKAQQELGHLGGRAGGGSYKKRVSWVVRGKPGQPVTVAAYSSRAGKSQCEIVL